MIDVFDLSGRVAIVTGAAGLLGTEHCICLARAGATVVAVDIDGEACRALCDRIAVDFGGKAISVEASITNREDLIALRERLSNGFGRIDILVNNAAMDDKVTGEKSAVEASRFEYFPLDVWQRVLNVNVTGTFLCCQVFGTYMAERAQGSIINIASTYGIVAPDQSLYQTTDGRQLFYKSPVYPTSKGAVIALTRFIAAYWGAHGVRANTISPGGVRAGQSEDFIDNYARRTPLKRMAEPTDFRGALLYLASDASRYVTGTNLVVDGGWTVW